MHITASAIRVKFKPYRKNSSILTTAGKLVCYNTVVKKIVVIGLISFIFVTVSLLTAAVVVSFTVIKPTTDAINQRLTQKFAKIVRIPQGIPPPVRGIDTTSYFWEMETLEKEVTGVRFMYDPAFTANNKLITAILEMPEGGDPSIFNKVLAAVVADDQTVKSAQDIERANLTANQKAGYSKIDLMIKPETKQALKILWTFDKNDLEEDLKKDYQKLSKYPKPIFGFLYGLPNLILGLLSG